MSFVYAICLLIQRVYLSLIRRKNILATKYLFWINRVESKNYVTCGRVLVKKDSLSQIIIGNNVTFNNGTYANPIGFVAPCQLTAINGGSIIIEDFVGMSQTAICAFDVTVKIAHHSLIGGGVKIYSTDFHSIDWKDRHDGIINPCSLTNDKKNRKSAAVSIGHDCFIGAGSIILKGVTIGDRAVIGAGSVVTKDIPADCIAAGNPCRVIKSLL